MKTREPTKQEKEDLGKKVSPIVDSIFNTFVKADLDDDIIVNVCFSMVFRIIVMFEIDKENVENIFDEMYERMEK